jgi:hypothetical protein
MSEDIYGMRPENRGDTATATTATATAFNPFDALGVAAGDMDLAQITAAWRRAHQHLNRATATGATPAFPTTAEVNAARDYLRDQTGTLVGLVGAVNNWNQAPRTFFGELPVGAPGVFTATAATATAGPAPIPASAGARARRSPPKETPKKKKAKPSTATPSSGATPSTGATPMSGSQYNPVNLDDDDDDDHQPSTPTPAATATPSSSKKPAQRSSLGSARATAAANPNVEMEIVVGEWAKSTATPRNAVIARLDARGRLNFRVVARTVAGVPIPGPTATATGYANIVLVGQYAGMTYDQLRNVLLSALSFGRELGN